MRPPVVTSVRAPACACVPDAAPATTAVAANRAASVLRMCRVSYGVMRVALGRRTGEQRSLALADADAQGGQAVAAAAPAQLVQEGHDKPSTAHPERMADRDRPAVHVDALRVEAQLADDCQALGRERLVELDEVEL